jgi:hypothetical protein
MVTHARSLGFKDHPDYEKLREYLRKDLLDMGGTEDQIFEWNVSFLNLKLKEKS